MIDYQPAPIFERPWRQSVVVSLSSTQSIAHNTITKVEYNNVVHDPMGLYDAANHRVNVPAWAQFYSASSQNYFTSAAANVRAYIRDYASGGATYQLFTSGTDGQAVLAATSITMWPILTTGRYIEGWAFQNAGAARNLAATDATTGERNYLSVTFYP